MKLENTGLTPWYEAHPANPTRHSATDARGTVQATLRRLHSSSSEGVGWPSLGNTNAIELCSYLLLTVARSPSGNESEPFRISPPIVTGGCLARIAANMLLPF